MAAVRLDARDQVLADGGLTTGDLRVEPEIERGGRNRTSVRNRIEPSLPHGRDSPDPSALAELVERA
jgi:hypothetical protein